MANEIWRPFPESCPSCGSDSEIFTSCEKDAHGHDGDPVRCTECEIQGYWSGDEESDFYVNWDY